MIPTRRKRRRNTSLRSKTWWSGSVSVTVFINWCLMTIHYLNALNWFRKVMINTAVSHRLYTLWDHACVRPLSKTLWPRCGSYSQVKRINWACICVIYMAVQSLYWLFFCIFLQGSCLCMSPERGGTEGPQCCPLTLERSTRRGVTRLVWEDEEWPVFWGRSHTQDEDGHGGREAGPCSI